MVELAPISLADARAYLEKNSSFRGEFNLAISARDALTGSTDQVFIRGVIVLKADGDTFALGHIFSDGSAQIGSLLYGAAWRTAKALGYKAISI